jgi:ABC-type multidrug transport system fused ATPase/permease subunit
MAGARALAVAWQAGLAAAVAPAMVALATPRVRDGSLSGVSLAALALLAVAALEATFPLFEALQQLAGTLASVRRLRELEGEPVPVSDPPAPRSLPRGHGLVARGLGFTYPGAAIPALRDLSFNLAPGGRLAVVGPSGAGKSTLLALLQRFLEYPHGSLRLDGVELRDLAASEVRSRMAVVSQRCHLFAGTLRDNLLLARPHATAAELAAACRRARLDATLAAMPRGWDTWIGEQGLRLSGGERQRVSLARALLRDAPILLLDEPTAHLDAATEAEVLAALDEATAGRATLTVTHRLAGLDRCDRILLLASGAVVEAGPERELLAAGRAYRRMWALQRSAAGGAIVPYEVARKRSAMSCAPAPVAT